MRDVKEIKPETVPAKPRNVRYLAILAGSFLMLACAREAGAMSTPLALRSENDGVYIHNGVTRQTVETAYGSNLLALAFTGTTTYDFYSPSLSSNVNLVPNDKCGGMIYMQNTSTNKADDFSVSSQMQFFDYDPVTGAQVLIADTKASPHKNVNHARIVNWALPNALLPANTTIPAGHMIHVAMTIGLVSGNPTGFGQVLYNGPSDSSTAAYFPQNRSALLSWPLVSSVIPPPADLALGMLPDGRAQINCSGTPGGTYLIQATTSLLAGSWTTIGTNVVGTNGLSTFIDQDAPNYRCRFYRLATP